MHNRIIFLDMDGVLVTMDSIHKAHADKQRPGTAAQVDQRCAAVFNEIIRRTGAKVVVSSSWRVLHQSAEAMQAVLDTAGIKCEVIDITSLDEFRNACRGRQILHWLESNQYEGNYVILDDDSDMLEVQIPYFVQTDPINGLTEDDIPKIERILIG